MKTVNLELSKKLKKAGYPQESEFWWVDIPVDAFDLKMGFNWILKFGKYVHSDYEAEHVASPTVDEILEQLPQNFKDEDYGELTYYCYLSINGWNIDYGTIEGEPIYDKSAITLADAAAKMWLYLKENNLLEEKETIERG